MAAHDSFGTTGPCSNQESSNRHAASWCITSPENPNDLVVYDGERYRWQNDPEKPVDFNEKEFREVSRLADWGCKLGSDKQSYGKLR